MSQERPRHHLAQPEVAELPVSADPLLGVMGGVIGTVVERVRPWVVHARRQAQISLAVHLTNLLPTAERAVTNPISIVGRTAGAVASVIGPPLISEEIMLAKIVHSVPVVQEDNLPAQDQVTLADVSPPGDEKRSFLPPSRSQASNSVLIRRLASRRMQIAAMERRLNDPRLAAHDRKSLEHHLSQLETEERNLLGPRKHLVSPDSQVEGGEQGGEPQESGPAPTPTVEVGGLTINIAMGSGVVEPDIRKDQIAAKAEALRAALINQDANAGDVVIWGVAASKLNGAVALHSDGTFSVMEHGKLINLPGNPFAMGVHLVERSDGEVVAIAIDPLLLGSEVGGIEGDRLVLKKVFIMREGREGSLAVFNKEEATTEAWEAAFSQGDIFLIEIGTEGEWVKGNLFYHNEEGEVVKVPGVYVWTGETFGTVKDFDEAVEDGDLRSGVIRVEIEASAGPTPPPEAEEAASGEATDAPGEEGGVPATEGEGGKSTTSSSESISPPSAAVIAQNEKDLNWWWKVVNRGNLRRELHPIMQKAFLERAKFLPAEHVALIKQFTFIRNMDSGAEGKKWIFSYSTGDSAFLIDVNWLANAQGFLTDQLGAQGINYADLDLQADLVAAGLVKEGRMLKSAKADPGKSCVSLEEEAYPIMQQGLECLVQARESEEREDIAGMLRQIIGANDAVMRTKEFGCP